MPAFVLSLVIRCLLSLPSFPDVCNNDHRYNDSLTNTCPHQIWAAAQSTVGSGAEIKVHSRDVPITINDVTIRPHDIVFADPIEGVVVIPNHLVDQTIELMPKLVAADDKVKEDVAAGTPVKVAFQKHRN